MTTPTPPARVCRARVVVNTTTTPSTASRASRPSRMTPARVAPAPFGTLHVGGRESVVVVPIPRRLRDEKGVAARSSPVDLDRGDSSDGAGAGNDNPDARCPVCKGTGWKPCGQCDGTGVNQEDLYGGKPGMRKGERCWLCEGKKRTMCGNCVDLTDAF